MRFSILFVCAVFIAAMVQFGCSSPKQVQAQQTVRTAPLVQDEFSELDDDDSQADTAAATQMTDDYINDKLETARQYYMSALRAQTERDSVQCEQEFEHAIDVLNSLASYPSIESDSNFVALSKSIVRDYELYIQEISTLPSQSPIAVLREKIAEDVESLPIDHSKPVPVPNQSMSFQIQMPLNDYVQQNIRFLTNDKGRKFMERVLARTGRYFPMVSRIFKEEGVPDELKYLAVIESGLDPNIVSWAKAVGMWQFIQSTGSLYGLKINWWADERRDPEKATRAAAKYLRDRYNELHDWHCAIASYDCGQLRIIKSRLTVGDTNADFWAIRDYLPRETKNYVPLYIAAATIAMNPALYGFTDIHPESEWKYDTVHVHEAVNFKALAKCAGCSPDDIASLNPELMQGCTPPNADDYVLRVPLGSGKDFQQQYAQLTDDDKRILLTHVVHRHETLRSIADAYGVSATELASFNNINVHKHLARGTTLRIPIGNTELAEQADAIQELHANDNDAKTSGRKIVHRVHRGETLTAIAAKYHVRVSDVRRWNRISSRRRSVAAGVALTLYLPGGSNASTASVSTGSKSKKWMNYRVRRGDTMAKIADAYDVSVQQLRAWNHGRKASQGAHLRIYTAYADAQPAVSGKYQIHRVRKGETLAQIADNLGVQESDLKEWNNLKSSTILAGEKLRVYQTSEAAKGDGNISDAAPGSYRVHSGDTLEKIARKFGVSVSHLKKLNRHATDENLRVGQKIVL
ncbi:MAG TPA: LysM peptidoglycan-binding domain-containing protein [Candidatus Kapabacteria bacterium]|nr:LysM peptidoglycan-binding domain-containing protein [Candidatus Kapabacteria bacterium]